MKVVSVTSRRELAGPLVHPHAQVIRNAHHQQQTKMDMDSIADEVSRAADGEADSNRRPPIDVMLVVCVRVRRGSVGVGAVRQNPNARLECAVTQAR